MKQILNTLYITTQESYLSKEGECVVINREKKAIAKIPIHTLDSIVLFGQSSCSPYLMKLCADHGVGLSWLTQSGRYLATMSGSQSGNVLVRRSQYRAADDSGCSAAIARAICIGKIYNCRTVLRRAARDYQDNLLSEACTRLGHSLDRLRSQQLSLDTIRGIEGEAASVYFGVFSHLIRDRSGAFVFTGRSRRPPKDAVNCMLSFGYTLLANDVRSALECSSLDPAVGYLHRDRPGRPGLALDIMEEFRAYLVDRLVCTLINRGQVSIEQFSTADSGAVLMNDDLRKSFILAWQERKKEIVTHPYLQEKMPVGLLWHAQARLMTRTLRGDQAEYTPYTTR